MYDPLRFVLLLPFGSDGWSHGLIGVHGKKVTQKQYYSSRLMDRDGNFSALKYSSRLTQEYIVDAWAKVEEGRLQFVRHNQQQIRADLYQGLRDQVNSDLNPDAANVGRRIILPGSFIGSPRFFKRLYQDSMAIVRRYGKPSFFVTFTANPDWAEIKAELQPGQVSSDRPDIVSRVFRLKLRQLKADIDKGCFGSGVSGYVSVVEFQKRGLPHAHILIILKVAVDREAYDQFVSAEIPEQGDELRPLVTKFNLHGPCGTGLRAPCMQDDVCSKKFPKAYTERTFVDQLGFVHYQRRHLPRTNVEKNGHVYTNQHVVPYNRFFTKKYQAHINVEICNNSTAVKYLYKYVYKGSDRTHATLNTDEIQFHVDARWIACSESCYRLFGFRLHEEYPKVERLAVHLENHQNVLFGDVDN